MSSEEPTSPASPEQHPPESEEPIIVDDDSAPCVIEATPYVEKLMPQVKEEPMPPAELTTPVAEERMPQEDEITHPEDLAPQVEVDPAPPTDEPAPQEENMAQVEEPRFDKDSPPQSDDQLVPPGEQQLAHFVDRSAIHVEEESLVPVPSEIQEPMPYDEDDSMHHFEDVASRPEAVRVILSTDDDRIELPQEDRVEFITGDERASGIRRRRSMGDRSKTPELPLNLHVGFRVSEGGPDRGTPSPCGVKFIPSTRQNTKGASSSFEEFRNKQQSFEIHIEDCDEEEIAIDSDGEMEGDGEMCLVDPPITPVPVQDYGSVTYTEGPQPSDFLQVKSVYNDCLTDVSDAESDGNDDA